MARGTGRLAHILGDLAVQMQAGTGSSDTLRVMVEGATHIVPGDRLAGISFIEGLKVTSQVPTDPLVAKLDELQTELNDGPCLTALREFETFVIDYMSSETRCPQF